MVEYWTPPNRKQDLVRDFKPEVKMILATGLGGALGVDNGLLEHIPEDMNYFRKQTEASRTIMGRKTFESLPFTNGLPNRENIVLSRGLKPSVSHTGKSTLRFINNIEEAFFSMPTACHTWIIGGAEIYNLLLDRVSEVHWTHIDKQYPEADTHINMNFLEDTTKWQLVSSTKLNSFAIVRVYRRIGKEPVVSV